MPAGSVIPPARDRTEPTNAADPPPFLIEVEEQTVRKRKEHPDPAVGYEVARDLTAATSMIRKQYEREFPDTPRTQLLPEDGENSAAGLQDGEDDGLRRGPPEVAVTDFWKDWQSAFHAQVAAGSSGTGSSYSDRQVLIERLKEAFGLCPVSYLSYLLETADQLPELSNDITLLLTSTTHVRDGAVGPLTELLIATVRRRIDEAAAIPGSSVQTHATWWAEQMAWSYGSS